MDFRFFYLYLLTNWNPIKIVRMIKAKTFIGMAVMLLTLTGMIACSIDDIPVYDNSGPTESLYGEWRLVGWMEDGTWFEVDTNYVSHHHLSIEFRENGSVWAWSMVNEITVGQLTLNGNEMNLDTTSRGSEMVLLGYKENLFFESHIYDIKSYQISGKQLKLYFTDEDYFVFTKDYDDSEEYSYAWKNGPTDPYIGEVTAIDDGEVIVKIVNSPAKTLYYTRSWPPSSSYHNCHFATSDLPDLSFEIGDMIAFRISKFRRQKGNEKEYLCVVEPCKDVQHVTDRTGTMFKDRLGGWMIIDDEKNEKDCGIYYYPLKALPEAYLVDGLSVIFSGGLYSTPRLPSEASSYSDCYYLDIDAIELASPPGSIVVIDETTFPDAGLRDWLARNCKWANDNLLTQKEIEGVTSLDISSSSVSSLKGIEFFFNLISLKASNCGLKDVDVSKNTELVYMDLDRNQLKSIDLSKNTKLEKVHLERNLLTSIDLTGLKKLVNVYCYQNQIYSESMDALIASLSSECPDTFCVINARYASERNVITKSQVATAMSKGWKVIDWHYGNPQKYDGSDE